MRRDLRDPYATPVWPDGVRLHAFTTPDAAVVHDLLTVCYRDGGGSVAAFSVWWASLAADAEFDPDLMFVAVDGGQRTVGVAQCWTSGFVKDLVVHPRFRRRGLGRALLLHAFAVLDRRGLTAVRLKVEVDNPSNADRLYRSVGMVAAD